jgi:hypothetical protein
MAEIIHSHQNLKQKSNLIKIIRRLLIYTVLLLFAILIFQIPAYSFSPIQLILINTIDQPLPPGVKVLEDYGAFVLAEAPVGDIPALQQSYLIATLPERSVVSLPGVRFDTLREPVQINPALQSSDSDPYFLVQFYGPTKAEWVQDLEQMGVTFLGYHPNFTFLVRMEPALAPKIASAHAVQWVGRFHPAYRLAPEAEMALANREGDYLQLIISAFPDIPADELISQLAYLDISIELVESQQPVQILAWATVEKLEILARLPGIYRIEPYILPSFDNEQAVAVSNTWDVWRSTRNSLTQDLMGQGQIAGMVDSGLDNNSTSPLINDFYDFTNTIKTSRVQAAIPGAGCGISGCFCAASDNASGHGTHVAGSIIGNGYNALLQLGLQNQARGSNPFFDYAFGVGQAPEAKLVVSYVSTSSGSLCGLGVYYTTWLNVYNQGARNVNNSWGSSGAVSYGGSAVSADRIMWDYQDYLVITSASNDGPNWITVSQPGVAKNILSVGAAGNHRPAWAASSNTATVLTEFSGRGPVSPVASDGRAKPDIVAPGANILSTRTTFLTNNTPTLWYNESGDGDGDGKLDYVWSGGTSMSTPHVTGAATIVRNYLQDIKGFTNTQPPSAAIIRAMLLNGAVDMGYGYEAFTSAPYGGRNMQGWGMVNVEQSILPHAPRSFIYDDFTNITNSQKQSTRGLSASGQYVEYTVSVVDSSEPLKVTLTWTDRQLGSDGFAVNNLDLLVTSPGATQYLGNVFNGSWSTTGGSADSRNSVEAIYIQNPALGVWKVRVLATTIVSTQPYALMISAGLGANPSYTRQCIGFADCAGRIGSSALANFPTLKLLSGTQEHTHPGTTLIASLRLTNWGLNNDALSLNADVLNLDGSPASNIQVDFIPTGPINLPSGASQDIQAIIKVSSVATNGPYDVMITASGTGGLQSAQVIGLNVAPIDNLLNQKVVVTSSGPQYLPDLWGSGQNLWIAYKTGENNNNSENNIRAMCSTNGGQTWVDAGQVNAADGLYTLAPAIAGSADGGRVTVLWPRADGVALYARTWTRTSGCTGAWGSIITLSSLSSGSFIADPTMIYDNNGDILAAWLEYTTSTNTGGIRSSVSTNGGASWSTKAWVTDASGTGATHRWPAFTLDTRNNQVWMAYSFRNSTPTTLNRDIRLKRWDGVTNAWVTGFTNAASTSDREAISGVAYIQGASAADDSIWVAWHRYASDFTTFSARLYYARSSGTLPSISFPTAFGPYATRSAEYIPPAITGDSSYAYISYLAYNDTLRGANPYILRVPIAGGAPDLTYQVSASQVSGALKSAGNAGMARLRWLTTTILGETFSGPTVLYSKSSPAGQDPNFSAGLGAAQTFFNLRENFDLYLAQAKYASFSDTFADLNGVCAGNTPCFTSLQNAINAAGEGRSVTVYTSAFNENVTLNKNATVNLLGDITINNLAISAGVFNTGNATLKLTGNFTYNSGTFNSGNSTIIMQGSIAQTIGSASEAVFNNLEIDNPSGVNLAQNAYINRVLKLSDGLLTLGDYHLTIGSNGLFDGQPSASAMIVPTGSGELRKVINAGLSLPTTFPVGDNDGTAEYSPITLEFAGVSGSGTLAIRLVDDLHPDTGATPRLSRYWVITQSGLSEFACKVTLQYVDDDLDLGASTEDQLYAARYDGANWLVLNPADPAENTLSITVKDFSDFSGAALVPSGNTLALLKTTAYDSYIEIDWETLEEDAENLGFNIYRTTSPTPPLVFTPLNASLIDTQGVSGGSYSFQDTTIETGPTYFYWLEFVGSSLNSLFEQPVFAFIHWKAFLPLLFRN